MARLIYLTHPQVAIDPAVPVPDWGLSGEGAARVAAAVARGAFAGVGRVVSSGERKARETAAPIAEALGLVPEARAAMGENDRSATGFLPGPEFEATADRFFAEPDRSVRGWERAVDAQARIAAEVAGVLARPGAGDVLSVGHGAVGTLLMCHLAGWPIDRRHDQPAGGGNLFAWDRDVRRLMCRWTPLEAWPLSV